MSTVLNDDQSSRRNNNIFQISNITNFISIQLDGENYLVWRHQFKTILQTLDIASYVDSSSNSPSTTDPEFTKWKKIDSYVQFCINATLHPSIASIAIGTELLL